ncbi:TRSP domain-containing protein, partial [Streptomyces hydrogenans]|uniref:TRSP domain-containing protein n=1 Tax=Streptomyces hydrogenans TaxID=1873719 RepID=UPI00345D1755
GGEVDKAPPQGGPPGVGAGVAAAPLGGGGRRRGGAGLEPAGPPAPVRVALDWPADVPDGGRHGFTPGHRARLEAALPAMTTALTRALAPAPDHGPAGGPRVLVLGFEELMYAPLRLAGALEDAGLDVRYSTTTRSPVLAV